MLLDAAGRDVILVETVGVGQDEVEIARLAAVTLVLLTPGTGDDVQTIKAGIMEIADVFVINKADLPGAAKMEQEIAAYLSLLPHGAPRPPICRTVASEGTGITALLEAARSVQHGSDPDRAAKTWSLRLRDMLRERLLGRFSEEEFGQAGREVAAHNRDPYTIIHEWLRRN
jgi:LAO/AO transport system kinase